jgi:hypothetical protein
MVGGVFDVNDVPYEFVQAGGYVGPDFTGVFFFENVFWRVVIPLIFGAQKVNTLDSLQAMPSEVRQRLVRKDRTREAYKMHWADCLDYSQGRHYSRAVPPNSEVASFAAAADRDLCSAIADLSQQEPNANAAHHARMATEKCLKAFLCARYGFTADTLKQAFGHNLKSLANEALVKDPASEFALLVGAVNQFPPHEERYSQNSYTRDQLWGAYSCSQFAGAALMRILTPHNQRAEMNADLKNLRNVSQYGTL